MRLEDDYVFGGQNLHGLYLAGQTEHDPKVEILRDFAKFMRIAQYGVIPKAFSYEKCLDFAADNLPIPIDKDDILEKWSGKESQWSSVSGMRKLAEGLYRIKVHKKETDSMHFFINIK